MTWRGWFSFVLCVSSVFFFGSVITTDASALSDLTYTSTYDGTRFLNVGNFCNSNNNTPVSCDGYTYLLVEISHPKLSTTTFSVFAYTGSNIQVPVSTSLVLYNLEVPPSGRLGFYGSSTSGYDVGDTITFTLLDHNPFSANVSGSLSITDNGTYDVSSYAEAVVNVPPTVIQGDYHDDLVSINNTILIGCAVPLVIYFFYGIYKMILGGLK